MILALILAAYTNHAGLAISGVPIRLDAQQVTISNAVETVRVPLSIFPESEKRRIGADAGSTRFIPSDVRLALAGSKRQLVRAEARHAKGRLTQAEYEAFLKQAAISRKTYLDKAVETGLLLPQERRLLE